MYTGVDSAEGNPMVTYRESGTELIQARGQEGRLQFKGEAMRLGVFSVAETWYVGVHRSSGGVVARLSLEDAHSLKEAVDMLKYGFFLQFGENRELIEHLRDVGLLDAPGLDELE
jgi:hypothetical protein